MLRHSVTVRIVDMTIDQLLQVGTFDRLLDALSTLDNNGGADRRHVHVFSIGQDGAHTNVSFCVRSGENDGRMLR
jgi:hypothetical protein